MTARCQLSLIVDLVEAPPSGVATALTAILAAAPVASVTFRPAGQSRLTAAALKPLVEIAQRASAAALIAGEPSLVRVVKADGAHVAWSKDVASDIRAARDEFGARVIVGADAGRSRHDAMTIGESGCEYVAFGIPAHVEDRDTARLRQIDLIAWWSEIFEVPCVAFDIEDAEHAARLAGAGADFLAIVLDVEAAGRDPVAWLAPFSQAAAGKAP